ncbi:hypothetical protein [Phyllobacterium chamaecytisi]|uniref:hypothetical protein n=1 Tax=Phyllobacterium chamaecytisi TaxID=2876082 RepID=UPI001CCD451E|nr:hypothetical protein [Phyllobacterium sp. KW56]MBZ9605458.1 hypothetical protein [Phyllobacterium sp. KW56]
MQLLNGYFDTVVLAIAGKGDEVLRFMGDAVRAFLPVTGGMAAVAAYRAATEILEKNRDNANRRKEIERGRGPASSRSQLR